MKIVGMLGEGRVETVEVPSPEPDEDHAVVRVMASSICGTERHVYEHGLRPEAVAAGARNGGHEATGIVARAARGGRLKEGDRVNLFASMSHCGRCAYCRAGRWVLCTGERKRGTPGFHAEEIRIREDFCLPLADDIDFETGALFSDVLGTAYHVLRRLRVGPTDTVLVMGQGPIGLATTMIATFYGASVIASDVNPGKLELARACGAAAVLDGVADDFAEQVGAAAGAGGVTAAVDCAGLQRSRLACVRAVRASGRVGFVGLSDQGFALDHADFTQHFFLKDLELHASWYSNPADLLDLEMLVRRGLDPARMITHRFRLDDAQVAYDAMFAGRSGKVVFRPDA